MARLEQLDEVLEEVVAELVDEFLRVLADDEHLPDVALRLRVHLEAVRISGSRPSVSLRRTRREWRRGQAYLHCFSHTWQYHRSRWRPLLLSLLEMCFVEPTSALGMVAVFQGVVQSLLVSYVTVFARRMATRQRFGVGTLDRRAVVNIKGRCHV